MNNLVYVFLFCFWLGVFILTFRKDKLFKNAEFYSGLCKEKFLESKAFSGYKKWRSNSKKEKLITELCDSLSYIKNITILGRGENISAELMLEELSEFSPSLGQVYISMARYISMNEKLLASEALYNEIGSDYAKDIGAFLASWEDIPQEELLSSIEAYLNVLREERVTKQKSKDELISDLVYFPVVINCMLVLLNFIYVSYFIEQEETLAQLFFL
ncbi:MAG: hypothetical protein MJ148_01295 [Clostridia bacterium]|nr:hypothetical protein [Clostridia bacterium]